ncbi:MAG: YlxR family protein [Acidimicrobiales bacterium]
MGCRRTGATDGMVRVVRGPDGVLSVGAGLAGRGAWLCRDRPGCVDLAIRHRAFERALRGPVDAAQVELVRVALQSGAGPVSGSGSEDPVL